MTEESRKRRDANVKKNCGSCCHEEVCGWKEKYANEVSALVHEMQTATFIQYDMKCKHYHAETGYCNNHSHFIDSEGMSCSPAESSNWTMFGENDFCSYGERKDGEG